ncbi:hypothetical protein [Mesorhizobium sp. M0909]|uniref:hypothetical protein n=1 Tax=Mesorhizobium sp. M0909 TaxID=2957024 RepID=UPI003339646B
MIRYAVVATMFMLGTGFSADAAVYACKFNDGETEVGNCKLDSAGVSSCDYTYAAQTPALIATCEAWNYDGSYTSIKCAFHTAEAQTKAFLAPSKAGVLILGPGFIAAGITFGTPEAPDPHDILVWFSEGSDAKSFQAYCENT